MAERPLFDPPFVETRAPPLERYDWQQLERLTESLLAHEPGVVTASQYGTAGQTQYGIDTKAELRSGGCDVASCKKYTEIATGHLAEWSSAFLNHWESRWKSKGVRRFILVTTADIAPTKVIDAADTERARFNALEVGYELWGQPQLIEKMRSHPGIVAQFIGSNWVEIICGTTQREALLPDGASIGIETVDASKITALRAVLSGEAEQRVARGLEDLRAGDVDAVERTIADLCAEPIWSQLQPNAQARVLRFAVSAALHRDDLDAAVTLADQADRIEPAEEPRIAARIAFQRDGALPALAALGTPITRDGRQLQVALMLTSGDIGGAETVLEALDRDGPDPETDRLRIWALLMRNRRDDALTMVEELERQAGQWLATVRTAAVVRYAAALSPALSPEWFLNASPVDLDLVRDDDAGRALLLSAIDGFQSLEARTTDLEDRRWLLASLANMRERREDAQALARRMIAENLTDSITIAWILARRFDVDLSPSQAALLDTYANGQADQTSVRVLALMLVAQGDVAASRAVLEEHLSNQNGEALVEAQEWIARFAADIVSGQDNAAAAPPDNIVDAIQRARVTGDWVLVSTGFADIAGGTRPEPQTLAIAQLLASERQWAILAPYRNAILSFGTAEAVRVVAYMVAATESDENLNLFLENHRSAFRAGQIPPDVRRLVVDRQRRAGDLIGALAEARALSAESGVSADRHLEAELRASIGDTHGAAHIVRDLLRSADLEAGAALRWVETLRASDFELAQELWRYAVEADAERRHAVAAFMQAFSLGLEAEAAPLFTEVARVAQDGSSVVRTFDVSDLPEFIRTQNANAEQRGALYLDGRVPAHLLVEQENIGLDTLLVTLDQQTEGPLRLRLLRNGARPRHIAVGRPWSSWRLHMDIGALLIAAECDLMDVLAAHPHPITISSAVPAALLDMQRKATATQPARLELLHSLAALFGNGLTVRERNVDDRTVGLRTADEEARFDFGPIALIDAAFAGGVIDEGTHLRALAALRESGEISVGSDNMVVPLLAGARLWLAGAAAEQLALTDILPALCIAYDVGIAPEIATISRNYVVVEGAKAERAAWLGALRERLLSSIEAGKFVFVKRRAEREADVEEMSEFGQKPATVSLMDILIAEEVDGAVTWFEDRHLTGYPANRNHVIVEFVDVLDALVADAILSEAEVRARLNRFLALGGGFVQLDENDVVPALRTAPIVDGVLRETPALAAIRRNRAATRRLDGRLKIGPSSEVEDTRPDEVQLMTAEMRLAHNCLTAIWSDATQAIDECGIRSEWIWQALRVERSLRQIPEDQAGGAAKMLATLCFASAVECMSMQFELPRRLRRDRQRAFADWFWGAVVAPHSIGDPDIVDRIAAHFIQLHQPRLDGRDPRATEPLFEREFARTRLTTLPEPVRRAILQDKRFSYLVGSPSIEIVTIRGKRFEADRFWCAVRTARRYGRAKLRTRDGKRCRVARTADGVSFAGGLRARLAEAICSIFDAATEPLAELERLLRDLELTPEAHHAAMEKGRRAATPKQVSAVLAEARKLSAKAVYESLDEALRSANRRISASAFMPPPASTLMHFIRLNAGDESFSTRLATAAETLAEQFGSREMLSRLAGLPVGGLPAFAGVAIDQDQLRDMRAAARTPVATFRWAEAALAMAVTVEDHHAIAQEAVSKISRVAEPFIALLEWSVRAFTRDPEYCGLASADRLALIWLHADRVLDTFLRRGADPGPITRFFTDGSFQESLADTLNLSRFMEWDAASPVTLTPGALLFHAVGALLADRPLADLLDETLQADIRSAVTLGEDGESGPTPAMTFRNFSGGNMLGSFLVQAPAALCALAGEPEQARMSFVDRSIEEVGQDRSSAMAWALLAQHARTGLTGAQLTAAQSTLLEIDVDGLSMTGRDELPLPRLIVKAMGLVLPAENRSKIIDVIRATARSAAQNFGTPSVNLGDDERGTLDPIHELLEICATYAGIESTGIFERFEAGVIAVAEEWPAALSALRALIDRMIRMNGVVHALPLWRLHLYLNACP
ncbi:hypothetical protein [Novosphingobium lentum]|uniref:hypothetical protein n=1 Tax=Novosphingobium lentum TaxID=145287 RepID=UPI000A51129B|nr:hypothetical protein [Novosphingobium lentum]